MRTLVLGGARSGKSTRAEALAHEHEAAGGRVAYLATSRVDATDAEWTERIALHRARRPASWATIETTDVAAELARDDDALLLVDCLAVWITRMMDDCGIWDEEVDRGRGVRPGGPGTDSTPRERLQARVDELVAAVGQTRRAVVFVTNEVGLSVVPEHWSGRFFRDQLGVLNMRVAAACDRVELVVAGIPMVVKQ